MNTDRYSSKKKKNYFYFSAMRKFQSLDRQARVANNDTALETVHQNTITGLRLYSNTKLSTIGLDGHLVIWDLNVSIHSFKLVFFTNTFVFFINIFCFAFRF